MTVGKMIELLGGKAGVSCGRFHYGSAFGEPSGHADKVDAIRYKGAPFTFTNTVFYGFLRGLFSSSFQRDSYQEGLQLQREGLSLLRFLSSPWSLMSYFLFDFFLWAVKHFVASILTTLRRQKLKSIY